MDEIIALIGLSLGSIYLGWSLSTEFHRLRARQFWIKDGIVHCDGPISYEEAARIREVWENWNSYEHRLEQLP